MIDAYTVRMQCLKIQEKYRRIANLKRGQSGNPKGKPKGARK